MFAVSAQRPKVFSYLGSDIFVGICILLHWVSYFSFEFCFPMNLRQLLKRFSYTNLSYDCPFTFFLCVHVYVCVCVWGGREFTRVGFGIWLKNWLYFFCHLGIWSISFSAQNVNHGDYLLTFSHEIVTLHFLWLIQHQAEWLTYLWPVPIGVTGIWMLIIIQFCYEFSVDL